MKIRQIAQILHESKYVVCISGREMIVEDGIDSMRDMETAYEIEMKYGYSPEEVFSAHFFNTRAEQFYQFYREEVLKQDKEPGSAYTALADMERLGVLKATITRQLYNFPKRAGCQNVYNLHRMYIICMEISTKKTAVRAAEKSIPKTTFLHQERCRFAKRAEYRYILV